jgi:cytochrome c nitrite reductase small subunit
MARRMADRAELAYSIAVSIAIGLAAGIGSYTFIYARGYSYMTNDPDACANCHIMREYYDGWLKSSHRSVAVCNDCHTPPGFISKYLTKVSNGFWHSVAFTSGRYHEPIQIKPRNLGVVELNCRNCHGDIVEAIEGPHGEVAKLTCTKCHDSVGHMR